MKKKILFLTLFCAVALDAPLGVAILCAEQPDADAHKQLLAIKDEQEKHDTSKMEKTISFVYDNEDLVDIINFLAAKKGVNVILPQGANAISAKVTMSIDEKLSVEKAWNLLTTILDVAGYTLMPRQGMYEIIKNSPTITKEPLPLYIGVAPDKLPDTDKRIRYVYYLSNIKANDAEDSEIPSILKNILPQGTSSYKIDTATNGIIIVGKSNDIRAVMKIIIELDKTDFQENLIVIPMRHALARQVSDLFNERILKSTTEVNPYRLDAKQRTELSFFSKHIRIIPDDRTNNIIVLGRRQAIDRVRDFIYKYLDVELEPGKSVLHVYQLQYLSAASLEPVLKRIVESARTEGTGQATAGGAPSTGTQRTFDEVIIKADTPANDDSKYFGGNKLIIACRNDDWKVIEKLIQELDTPQPQVLLEVLVADLTMDDERIIGSLLRNPQKIPLGTAEVQAGNLNLNPAIIVNTQENPTSINADLLRADAYANPDGSGTRVSAATELTSPLLATASPGSTLVSMNDKDGRTWNILQFLQTLDTTKILSHPHVLATNNEKATVIIGQERLIPDEAAGAGGTTTTVKNKKIQANLQIDITPRISSADTVYLQVNITDSNFTSPSTTNNTRTERNVITNALVHSGNVLALGGLVRVSSAQTVHRTPILGQIPIIGYFFKERDNSSIKTNLSVFIAPTIIQPRLRGGVGQYTKDYIRIANEYAYEGSLFDSLRDPVTRWFFKADQEPQDVLDVFLMKDEIKSDLTDESGSSYVRTPAAQRSGKTAKATPDKTHFGKERKPKGTANKAAQEAELKKMIAADDTNPLLHV